VCRRPKINPEVDEETLVYFLEYPTFEDLPELVREKSCP